LRLSALIERAVFAWCLRRFCMPLLRDGCCFGSSSPGNPGKFHRHDPCLLLKSVRNPEAQEACMSHKTTIRAQATVAALFVFLMVGLNASAAQAQWFYTVVRYSEDLYFGLAGRDLNGVSLNGKVLDGHIVTSVSLKSATHDGRKVRPIKLRETKFVGVDVYGKTVEHSELDGAVFLATLDDGSTLELSVFLADRLPNPDGPSYQEYEVYYDTTQGPRSLCGEDESGRAIEAMPLPGVWDYSQGTPTGGAHLDDRDRFTFACAGYALHKCVDAGYPPWETVLGCEDSPGKGKGKKGKGKDKKEDDEDKPKGKGGKHCQQVSLAPYHQACTRLLRADFCGDGVSHTVNGIEVNMYDGLGIRVDSEDWAFEAEWDEHGAICARIERLKGVDLPSCLADLVDESCGDWEHLKQGALLASEISTDL
jgi:hypothetical protein